MNRLAIKHQQHMRHKGFFRHYPSRISKEKDIESTTSFSIIDILSGEPIPAGCSSAEPASVLVQQCKIQISKLYLQPVKIPSHFQDHHQDIQDILLQELSYLGQHLLKSLLNGIRLLVLQI
jgi:hypothetical protein